MHIFFDIKLILMISKVFFSKLYWKVDISFYVKWISFGGYDNWASLWRTEPVFCNNHCCYKRIFTIITHKCNYYQRKKTLNKWLHCAFLIMKRETVLILFYHLCFLFVEHIHCLLINYHSVWMRPICLDTLIQPLILIREKDFRD